MINIYYSDAYWGHSQTMNGPQKVVKNLLMSLDDQKIDYALSEVKILSFYSKNYGGPR